MFETHSSFVCLRKLKLELPVTAGSRSQKKQSLINNVTLQSLSQFAWKHGKIKSDFWVLPFPIVEKDLAVWLHISRMKIKNYHWGIKLIQLEGVAV